MKLFSVLFCFKSTKAHSSLQISRLFTEINFKISSQIFANGFSPLAENHKNFAKIDKIFTKQKMFEQIFL